jgi:hypothetical protein
VRDPVSSLRGCVGSEGNGTFASPSGNFISRAIALPRFRRTKACTRTPASLGLQPVASSALASAEQPMRNLPGSKNLVVVRNQKLRRIAS